MELWINGQARTVRDGLTISELLDELEVAAQRVAVEVNQEIIRRSRHAEHRLRPADRVEVVTFVGGG